MPRAAAPLRSPAIFQTVRTFGRWDCINARQRERAKELRFAACTSLLTSPCTRRAPQNRRVLRVEAGGSLLRQTGCWREADSNRWSHFRVSTTRHRPDVAERQQRDPAPSPNSAVATITLFGQSSRRKRQRAQFHDKEKAPSVCFLGQYETSFFAEFGRSRSARRRSRQQGKFEDRGSRLISGPNQSGFCETQIRAAHALPGW